MVFITQELVLEKWAAGDSSASAEWDRAKEQFGRGPKKD